jgi:hypothetical protein
MSQKDGIPPEEIIINKLKQEISADYRAKDYFINRLTIDEVISNILGNELKIAIIQANQHYQCDKKDFKLNLISILDSLPKEVWYEE